jgi:6-phosphofructokinase 1
MASSGWASGDAPRRRIGVLNGGGPAPGLNGVIHAVTRAARRKGWAVVGIPKGFSQLIKGNTAACRELSEDDVEGIEVRGGSVLRTSRANPAKRAEDMAAAVASVRALGLTCLVTVGGDDTATSAMKLAEAAGIRAAHVPKTIDNDLPLPGDAPTFGFETAKRLGGLLCRNLRTDAATTGRWYLVTAMGRSAGHLALGMAAESEADLCVIPEELPQGVRLDAVARLVDKAIEARAKAGQDWGLVVLGEGILDRLDAAELRAKVGGLELDEHGNPRMSEIDLGRLVRDAVTPRLKARGDGTAFITKLIGYELRCADPVPFDVDYTRRLGEAAVAFLDKGMGSGLVTVDGERGVPIRLDDLKDPATGKVRVRRVDVNGPLWRASLAKQAR